MKNYKILADNEETEKKIRDKIGRLGLEKHLRIHHPQTEPNTPPIEVNYEIEDGDDFFAKEFYAGGGLMIYIDEPHPQIIVRNPDQAWITYHSVHGEGHIATFKFDDIGLILYDNSFK